MAIDLNKTWVICSYSTNIHNEEEKFGDLKFINHLVPIFDSHRNQSTDSPCKSVGWL